MLPRLRADAPVRSSRLHRLAVLAGCALATAVLTSGCMSAEAPVSSVLTAGGGSCKLPTVTLDPGSAGVGDSVTVRGEWFVEGCGGAPDLSPLTLIPVSLTDATGANFGLDPIDATGGSGTFEQKIQIPAKAAAGPGKVTVGQAAPVSIDVKG